MAKKDPEPEISLAQRRRMQREEVRTNLNKKFGQDTSGSASQRVKRYIPRISTGSFNIDMAMGGGWPRGRINAIWGSYSAQKTSTFLRTLADAQKRDAITNRYIHLMSAEEKKNAIPMSCAWVDVEGSFDREWALKQGVNLEELEYTCPLSQEEACTAVEQYILSQAFDCIFLDSLAAMASEKEVQGEMGDHNVGVAARLNNQMFRKVQSAINRMVKDNIGTVPTFFFINQERHKIGVTFGPTTTKPGGVAQEFFTSVVLHMSGNKIDYYDTDRQFPKCVESYFKIEKNKTYPPKINGKVKQALVDDPNHLFTAGQIVESSEVISLAEKIGLFEKVDNTTWRLFDQVYKRKSDLIDEWFADKEKFSILKGVLLTRLFPHQENDWKITIDMEKEQEPRKGSQSTSGPKKIAKSSPEQKQSSVGKSA